VSLGITTEIQKVGGLVPSERSESRDYFSIHTLLSQAKPIGFNL
jgi:hypothetical protein